ncbi:MAG: YdcF family protein [Pseudolabrys sp.]
MVAVIAGVIVLAVGFVWFVSGISTEETRLDRNADGVVVLTGAAARIPDAMELLASGRGKRLLITGVHRATTAPEIARLTPIYTKEFACCVDLDHSALNTLGNAIETRRWAREKNFQSLIVVTSNWHMPRAMAEIAHQLPDATLIAFPVIAEKSKAEVWWSNGGMVRLYLAEYLKYVFAVVRISLDPDLA